MRYDLSRMVLQRRKTTAYHLPDLTIWLPIPRVVFPAKRSWQSQMRRKHSQYIQHLPGPGAETNMDDQSGVVASRPTETLRSLFRSLWGLLGSNTTEVWQQGSTTKCGNEVYTRLPWRSKWTSGSVCQSNQRKLELSRMAPAGQQEPLHNCLERTTTRT